MTPERALQLLKEGNQRFVADKSRNQKLYRKQAPLTAKGQYPFAVILSCIGDEHPELQSVVAADRRRDVRACIIRPA